MTQQADEVVPLKGRSTNGKGHHMGASNNAIPIGKDLDDDVVLCEAGGRPGPLVGGEGQYIVGYLRGQIGPEFYGKPRVFLYFRIVGGPDDGRELFGVCVLPEKGKSAPMGSKIYRWVTIANHGRPPKRKDRLTLNVFKGKYFRVLISTVKNSSVIVDRKRLPHPEQMRYPIVEEILSLEAGG